MIVGDYPPCMYIYIYMYIYVTSRFFRKAQTTDLESGQVLSTMQLNRISKRVPGESSHGTLWTLFASWFRDHQNSDPFWTQCWTTFEVILKCLLDPKNWTTEIPMAHTHCNPRWNFKSCGIGLFFPARPCEVRFSCVVTAPQKSLFPQWSLVTSEVHFAENYGVGAQHLAPRY